MESINCIFCRSEREDSIVIEENGFAGRQCSQCGLIYISPRPALDEILNLYGHDEPHVSAEAHIGKGFRKRLYARHNLAILTKYIRTGSILEVGAGAGYFLEQARMKHFDPYGVELNAIQANFMR